MPQEEIKKQQEQTASGGEGPGGEIPSGGWGFFMTYLLQRLDGIEDSINSRIDRLDGKIGAVESNLRGEMNSRLDSMEINLRGEIKQLGAKIEAVETNLNTRIDGLHGEITGLRQETNSRIDGLHREVHNTTLWIVGTIIAVVGVAVAVMQALK